MGAMAEKAADPVRGLAVSDHGLTLGSRAPPRGPAGRSSSRFRILDADGQPVRDFDVEHAKRMHLIVVRRDLTGYQHLHPTLARRRHLGVAAHAARRPAPTARSPTSRSTATPTTLGHRPLRRRRRPLAAAARAGRDARTRRRLRRRARARRAARRREASSASRSRRGGRPVTTSSRTSAPRPPRRAARGRPRLPARPSRRATRRRDRFDAELPDARAATASSCSSRSTASSTPPPFTREVAR